MSDDARAMRGGDLSHDDAQALVSARMDGPLDTERNRLLLAHLAGCPMCAAFASTMEGMAVGFREIPVLPPSPVVARAVRAEVRRTGIFRSFGRWLTSSRGLPMGALGVATVALAVVAASTFGPLADRVGGPQVAAPQASVDGAADSALVYDSTTPDVARQATLPPNVEVVPTEVLPTVVVVEVTTAPEATVTPEVAIEQRPTEAMTVAEVTEEAVDPTATLEPARTDTPAPPTDTPEPTATPAPPTATATETPTATPEATATGIIVVTSEALVVAETATPAVDQAGGSSPLIKPRDPAAPTVVPPTDDTGDNDAETDAATEAAAGSDQSIVARGDAAAETGSAAATDASGAASLAATDFEPMPYAELETTGAMYDEGGTVVVSPDGQYLALETAERVSILTLDGDVLADDWGHNPIWSDDSALVYIANSFCCDGDGAIWALSIFGSPTDDPTGGVDANGVAVFDVPAGMMGGELWYVRYRPDGSPSLELRSLAADEPLWTADDVALIGQNVYLSGGAVYAPTDRGWLRIAPGEQAVPLAGEPFAADEVVVSPGGDLVAFVAGDRVLLATADDPGVARDVGSLGVGGIAWTPYGLAIADGETLTLVTTNGEVVVITDGDGLSAPVWTPEGLTILGGDGEVRLVPEGTLALYAGR